MENIHLFSYYTIPVKLEDESFNIVPFGSCPIYKCKKEMKGISILFVLLFFFCNASIAQTLKGIVTDIQHPLPYATIRLLTTDSTFVQGTRTDSVGTFSLTAKHLGNYLLHVTSIGYNAKTLPVSLQQDTQLLPITLQANSVTLNEVTVEASSTVRLEDRLLLYPDKKQIKHAASGYDLLYRMMIPGVDVDRMNGMVKAFGGEVALYINGRKADYREVQNLRPKDIEKVEYYDIPTGKYIADNAAINFITKTYKSGGYIALDGKQYIGYVKGDYNVAAKLSHGNTQYTLFGGYSMNKYTGDEENMSERFIFSDHETERLSSTLDSHAKNNQQYAQLNITNENDKRTLTGKISLVRNDSPDNYRRDLLEYNDNETKRESYQQTSQSGLMPGVELYGYFHLNDQQYLEAKVYGNYNRNKYSYNYSENQFETLTDTKENYYELNADISYGVQLKHQNSFTARLTHFHTISSALYEGNLPSWQHLWMGRSRLLMEYSQKFGKKLSVKLVPGVESIQYRLHGDKHESYILPCINARILYRPTNNQQMMFNIYWGNEAPSVETMSKAEQQVDSLHLKKSYPFRKLPNACLAMFMYSGQFGRLGIEAAANYLVGKRLRIVDYYADGNMLVESLRNDGTAHNIMAEFSASWKLSDDFRLKMDGEWFYLRYKNTPYKLSNLSVKFQADYYWKDFSFSAYGKTRSKAMDSDLVSVTTPAGYGLFATWAYNNWHVEIGAENLFMKHRSYKYTLDTKVYSYQKMLVSRINQQTGYVKISYTFDFGRKTSRDSRDVNTHINSAILKAN